MLQLLRDDVSNTWSLLQNFGAGERDFDHEKAVRFMTYAHDRQHTVPLAFCYMHYRGRLNELAQYDQLADFESTMCVAPMSGAPVDATLKKGYDLGIIEECLASLWDQMKGKSGEKDLVVLAKSCELMKKAQQIIVKRDMKGMGFDSLDLLVTALDVDSDNSAADQSTALQSLKELIDKGSCIGILNTFKHNSQSSRVITHMEECIATKQKGLETRMVVLKSGGFVDALKDFSVPIKKTSKREMEGHLDSLVAQLQLQGSELSAKDDADIMKLVLHMKDGLRCIEEKAQNTFGDFASSLLGIKEKKHLADLASCQALRDDLVALLERAEAMGVQRLGVPASNETGKTLSIVERMFAQDGLPMLRSFLATVTQIKMLAESSKSMVDLSVASREHLSSEGNGDKLAAALALRNQIEAMARKVDGSCQATCFEVLDHLAKFENLNNASDVLYGTKRRDFVTVLTSITDKIVGADVDDQLIVAAAKDAMKSVTGELHKLKQVAGSLGEERRDIELGFLENASKLADFLSSCDITSFLCGQSEALNAKKKASPAKLVQAASFNSGSKYWWYVHLVKSLKENLMLAECKNHDAVLAWVKRHSNQVHFSLCYVCSQPHTDSCII
jgi:hypothetical protein